MKSKLIIKYLLVFVLLTSLASCEDVLEPKIYGDLTEDNFFNTEADFNAAVVALYNPFSIDWGKSDPGVGVWYVSLYNANNRSYLMRSMLSSDILWNDWDPNILNFTWGPSTFNSNGAEGSTYAKIRFVARATDVIDKISKSDVNESVKNKYIAEAKTLRAWLMYILYDFFGPVNVKIDAETLSNSEITPRLSDEEYTKIIEQDLLDAIATQEIPDSYNNNLAEWGRVSKGVARMLLLKLYMHKKDWEKAEVVGKEIMNMEYSLDEDYANIFTEKANSEIIYAIPSNDAMPNWYMQHLFPGDYAKGNAGSKVIERGGGWYGYAMPWDVYDKYEVGDLRTNTIITEYEADWGGMVDRNSSWFKGAIPLKYTGIQGNGPSYAIDWVVFRYADVLLLVSEAINEQRGPNDAYQFVNQVRERAGVAPWSGMTKEQFRDAILEERGKELFGEGVRRQDLIRHGKCIEKAIERGVTNAKPHHVLFPIPEDVIIEGEGVVKQNNGY